MPAVQRSGRRGARGLRHSTTRFAAGLAGCLLVLLAASCGQPLTPQQVADRFWRAVVTQHPAKIRRYVLAEQRALLERDAEVLAIGDYRLGRVVIDGAVATIATDLTLAGDTPVPISITTRLMHEQGEWRVDYAATVEEISARSELARVIEQIGQIGDTLRDGIDRSVDEMSKALPRLEEELSRLESQIRQRMPALRERIEDFARRLEEALAAPPEQAEPPRPQPPEDETIAL